MINCYSLIIASSIDGRVCINDVTQLCHIARVYQRPLNLVWKSRHNFIHIELSLVTNMVFISWGGYTALLYSSESLSFVTVSLTLGALGSSSCMFIGVNLELSSLVLLNKSHPFSCRRLYAIFPTIQMYQLHGQKHFIRHMDNDKFLCITIQSWNYFSQYNIHPYLTKNFKMPSISTITSLKLCTNPICQQRGFILDK